MASKFWAHESAGSGTDSDESDSDSSIGEAGRGTGPSRWQVDSDSESEEEVRDDMFLFSLPCIFSLGSACTKAFAAYLAWCDSAVWFTAGVALNYSPIILWGDISKGLQSLIYCK